MAKELTAIVSAIIVLTALFFGARYIALPFYWSNEQVDSRLSEKYGDQLQRAGIISIDAVKSMASQKILRSL